MRAARIDPEAEAELREAAAWYKDRSPAVARRFLSEVRGVVRVVAKSPLRFPMLMQPEIDATVRRALVPGFPYAVVFLTTEDAVHVLAVAHQHRMPGYWLHRLRPEK